MKAPEFDVLTADADAAYSLGWMGHHYTTVYHLSNPERPIFLIRSVPVRLLFLMDKAGSEYVTREAQAVNSSS